MRKYIAGTFAVCLMMIVLLASAGQAIQVTQTSDVNTLAAALTTGNTGISVISSVRSGNALQTGTFTNVSGVYSTAIGSGIVLSSGNVSHYSDGPNQSSGWTTDFGTSASAAQNALLTPISGKSVHYDPVQWSMDFTMDAGFNDLYFNMAFGSEEYAEYVGSAFNDAFGIYLNGTNIAFAGGQPISINHPWMSWTPGTELDGVMTAQFHGIPLLAGQTNNLTFILADASDHVLDTTVYLSALGGEAPPDPNVVPEPASILLAVQGGMAALAGLAIRRRRA